MLTKRDAIANFLKACTHADLAALYTHDMEVQVNVAQDNGERIDGEYKGKMWHGWTDGISTWKSFRIPFAAMSNPHYEDSKMGFDLAKHADGVGMTGWDWKAKVSRWVAYDFDALIGDQHKGTGLSPDDLNKVHEAVRTVPWVTVRKSTSGNGLHLYVHLDPVVETSNHNEHAALSRAILGVLSAVTGFNFENKVDICGGNMWVWHRKMLGTEGLTIIKEGSPFSDVPSNWRDHVNVITGRQRRPLPQEIVENPGEVSDIDRLFAELTGQHVKETLDDDHKRLIDFLREHDCMWWWDQDANMLVTHTFHLKEAHEALKLKGTYKTVSTGRERGHDHNCFLYPLRKGGWVVRRFQPGVNEHESWDQDGSGWTRCYINVDPDLPIAARSHEGIEHPSGGYVFTHAADGQKAAKALGASMELPDFMLGRRTKLKQHKDGRLIAEIEKQPEDPVDKMRGWLPEAKTWKRIFGVNSSDIRDEEVGDFDDLVRHIVNERNEDAGWTIKAAGKWTQEPLTHVKLVLKGIGLNDRDCNSVLGGNITKRWTIVNKPFQPEYPGDRQWNRDSCQLRYHPNKGENRAYPTWMKMLRHVGADLDTYIEDNAWCRENGILTGADYLKCWIASVFQAPEEPLPYLFMYGPEASGKSMFHEALCLLVSTSGYQIAGQALLSQQGFNNELKNAVLCVVEETDLAAKSKTAYNRIKDWVTSPLISIHPKGGTPFLSVNTTHWVHCTNNREYCPIFPGDTRITVIYVDTIPKDDWEGKTSLIRKFIKEAPDFLGEIMSLEIPTSPDRLNIPTIQTGDKTSAQQQNMSSLDSFIDEQCFHVPGELIKFSDFHASFVKWLDPSESMSWTKVATGKALPRRFCKGRNKSDGQFYIGNIAWEHSEGNRAAEWFVNTENRLVQKGNGHA